MFKSALLVAVAATSITACTAYAAGHAPAAIQTIEVSSGKILTDTKGMSLYTFDKDAKGTSNCNGSCAVKWPPLFVAKGEEAKKEYSIITRADGSRQWAYKGEPLYTWFKDSKSGDVTGDGVKGVWHLARP